MLVKPVDPLSTVMDLLMPTPTTSLFSVIHTSQPTFTFITKFGFLKCMNKICYSFSKTIRGSAYTNKFIIHWHCAPSDKWTRIALLEGGAFHYTFEETLFTCQAFCVCHKHLLMI